ncbi:MAG: hypothetical protein ABJH28_17235 [Paraglaciecola sp.]|uniref:hypothetical protein n=1 Tax=Paraglaciecola sp. TaxID=1920173 RepID=UPI0032662919
MANKKSNEDNQSNPVSELDSLRNIVFGAAKSEIEQRISALEQQTLDSFKKMELLIEKNAKSLNASMQDGFNQLEDKLALADQGQEQKSAELNAYADKISSELEMAETSSKQETDELHKRIDTEVNELTIKFNHQLEEALAKLTQVSSELNSTKTDRKTLAKLLATVASNLETGDEE